VLDEAADRIASQSANEVDSEELEAAAVNGMLRALGDRWSTYYGPSDYSSFQESLEGRYTGVGLWVRGSADGLVVVSSVTPGSPAASAGVLTGDVVVAVDDRSTDGATVAKVAALLRGDPDTPVRLEVDRAGERVEFSLVRSTVDTRDVTVERLDGGITVVRVASFTRGVGRQVREAVDGGDDDTTGVVLDLRDDSGGLLTEAVEVASAFLDGGPVVSYERRGASTRELEAVADGDSTVPLVVLVDGGTASAAEVVAGALQDRERAVIVGSRTFGKGTVQEPTQLSDGSAIELTVGRYLTPSGRSIEGVGIAPDVLISPAAAPDVAERRAVEVLSGLQAGVDTDGRG
jgi:carboxyl-terminal processing protease